MAISQASALLILVMLDMVGFLDMPMIQPQVQPQRLWLAVAPPQGSQLDSDITNHRTRHADRIRAVEKLPQWKDKPNEL